MNRRKVRLPPLLVLTLAMTAPLTACGDDPPPPKTAVKKKILVSTTAKSETSGGLENGGDRAANGAKPSRKSDPLTREDFGPDLRDPFKSFLIDETIQAADEAPVVAERQRNVQMPSYNFEDLSLVGIIRSKRGVEPRALFVATDGISGTIKQGQYFSRAEVLLSSVNTGYVEIEIVDENLAKGLNLTNGETRAIYLKRE